MLRPDCQLPDVRDSKQLSRQQREAQRESIEAAALAWSIGEATPQEIDEINIVQASFLAMHRALDRLVGQLPAAQHPELLLVDGNRFSAYPTIPHECMVKGDARFLSIAAASVLAKLHRDALMYALAEAFPEYGWQTNVGYPTPAHKRALADLGPTPYHRRSFRWKPVPVQR